MREYNSGKIASVNGRYYAMDRDGRWERIAKAYSAMVEGNAEGGAYADPVLGMKESYNKGVTDEFVVPFVCTDNRGEALAKDGLAKNAMAKIDDDDSCISFNFRADRVREITRALCRNSGLNDKGGSDLPGAAELDAAIPRDRAPKNLKYVCMTQYDKNFNLPVVIPPESMANILANVMGGLKMRNLRVAETEKYAHVTYFFNGGVEQPFPGEERVMVQSPKVATYDLKPEMSAAGIAEAVVKATNDGTFDVIIVNFANADMVGHSGKIEPTIRAVETVDACLGEIEKAVRAKGGAMLITADHGNAEMMIDPATGGPHTAHTTNPVPFILMAENAKQYSLKPNGSLRDISPTMLGMLGIAEPTEMTGADLRKPLKT
jgi:2,3-bisphosphoglycerate-independent phosphoglycerate mutase